MEVAALNGLLDEEDHYLDFKEAVKSTKSANRELARDLASFALDGGVLLVGVRDPKHRQRWPGVLVPQQLTGLPEKIEQVALQTVDPPLYTATTPIRTTGDPDVGYVVVRVPPSHLAPHQVGGTYYGRGDKTKRPLSDPEVERHIRARSNSETQTLDLIRELLGQDPIQPGWPKRSSSHLFVVAEPIPVRHEILLSAKPDGHPETWLKCMSLRLSPDEPPAGSLFEPDLREGMHYSTRSDGWAVSTQAQVGEESRLLELRLGESGRISLVCGRASFLFSHGNQVPEVHVLFEKLILGLTLRLVRVASRVSAELRYLGMWRLGVGVSDTEGKISHLHKNGPSNLNSPFPGPNDYLQATTAPTEELTTAPEKVAYHLVGRFLRAAQVEPFEEIMTLLRQPPYGRALADHDR